MTIEADIVRSIGTSPDAFERFYRAHIETVQRFIARRVSDPHLAADCTSEVFLAAIDAAGRYDSSKGTPAGWLLGIARNVVADHVRRAARETRAVKRASARRDLAPDALARIEARIDAERASRDLYSAMAQLPERDRALLELVAVDGLPVGDAAAVLGITAGNARVRLHRSRTRLLATIPSIHLPEPAEAL